MSKEKSKKDHHHGDLKNALITAGIALLEEGGIAALSLRKCAAKAGVSHAAPAHHFDGLPGLRQAIAERAFDIFADHLEEARDHAAANDLARLKAICHGYLRFGINHPGLLGIIFAPGGLATMKITGGRDMSRAYLVLRDACAPFQPVGKDPLLLESYVWSLAHGFTLLTMGQEFGPPEQVAGPQRRDAPNSQIASSADGVFDMLDLVAAAAGKSA